MENKTQSANETEPDVTRCEDKADVHNQRHSDFLPVQEMKRPDQCHMRRTMSDTSKIRGLKNFLVEKMQRISPLSLNHLTDVSKNPCFHNTSAHSYLNIIIIALEI